LARRPVKGDADEERSKSRSAVASTRSIKSASTASGKSEEGNDRLLDEPRLRKDRGTERTRRLRPPSGSGSSRVKIIKRPRAPETIEAEISELEKRIAELSNEMARPEVARDITKLVSVNDLYQQSEARLAELINEWSGQKPPQLLQALALRDLPAKGEAVCRAILMTRLKS